MNKNKALTILQSIHKDVRGNWTIPHSYKHVEREVILSNGEKATLVVEDDVYEFLDYVKKLIESEEN